MSVEKFILRGLLISGLAFLPFLFRKPPTKDWIIVFFLKGFLSGLIDHYVVVTDRVKYPVRFFSKLYNVHLLFDALLFPIVCVCYNQLTYHNKPLLTLIKAFWFSIPMTLIEWYLERKTNLITWKKWSALHTFISETLMFWIVKFFMNILQTFAKGRQES